MGRAARPAWCQDQAGDKEKAIAGYRKVIEAVLAGGKRRKVASNKFWHRGDTTE
jgi:hypothetical protein